MAGVTRTGKQGVFAVYLSREKDSVAVVWQEGVFHLVEGLEISGPGHADGRSVITVAPCDVIFVFDFGHARVVAVHPLADFRVCAFELDGLRIDFPVETVF